MSFKGPSDFNCPVLKEGKVCYKCKKVGHLSYACLNESRGRRHSWSDNRPGSNSSHNKPEAESHSVEAGAATCWGHDANWVKSLIETTIHNDAIDQKNAEGEEFGSLG